MIQSNFKKNFFIKGFFITAILISLIILVAYSIASSKLEQDISYLNKRTSLQLNIEKERLSSWLKKISHYGSDFVEAEPLRTFMIALSNSETIKENAKFLNDEQPYIQTVLDGFVYQNSLKRASIIAGTGQVFLHSGFDGKLNKLQKQTALAVIAQSKLKYIPIKKEDDTLVLEVFKPIYGFVVDDLPVSVLHMVIEIDQDFIDLITKSLPIEEQEQMILWQNFDNLNQHIIYNENSYKLDLIKGDSYDYGFIHDKSKALFLNTIAIENSPFSLTLISKEDSSLKTYNLYVKNMKIIVLLIIVISVFIVWAVFSKIILKKYKQELVYKEKLANQSEKMVQALVKTLELRDPYLAGHHSNVKDIAIKIAEELELTEEDKSTLRYSALLSGIGKIAIPKYILTKPEKLTAEETKIMQSHVSFAEEILEDMEFDLPITQVVSQMYERLDGSGYPRALSGTQINKLSRILAVCDVFCALKSPRAYRDGKTEQQALEIMQNDIALFDADVLATLFKIVNK
jgi:HD-GYP domain-containing protein (c-di-GMP phosphodiesterase class II)